MQPPDPVGHRVSFGRATPTPEATCQPPRSTLGLSAVIGTAVAIAAFLVAILAAPALPNMQPAIIGFAFLLISAPLALWSASRVSIVERQNASLRARLMDAETRVQGFDRVAIVQRDIQGDVRRWSAGCEALLGFTAAEAIGRPAQELLVTRFPEGGRRSAQAILLRDGSWTGKLRHRHREGGVVAVMAHWILLRAPETGDPAGILEVYVDATSLDASEAALRAGEARLRLAQEVAAIGTWEWDPEEDSFTLSTEHAALFGPLGVADLPLTLERFLEIAHGDDREAIRNAFARALEAGSYEVEFRVPRPAADASDKDEIRWMIGRGQRMPGPVGRVGAILGIHVDITARKEAEQRQALLAREVDHRAKNALAVVQAVLRLTRAESPEAFARAVEDRVAALARAHTLLAEANWTQIELQSLLRGEFAPFLGPEPSGRVRFEGPQVLLPATMVQPLSIALHELATNAAKYGALSTPEGRVSLFWQVLRDTRSLRLTWSEDGGPLVREIPGYRGFGSRIIDQTLRRQLGGTCFFAWRPEGLRFETVVPLERTRAPRGSRPAAAAEIPDDEAAGP